MRLLNLVAKCRHPIGPTLGNARKNLGRFAAIEPRVIHQRRWKLFRKPHLNRIPLQHLLRLGQRSVDDLAHGMRMKFQLHLMGIQLRHFYGLADKTIEALALLIDYRKQFLPFLRRELTFCQ